MKRKIFDEDLAGWLGMALLFSVFAIVDIYVIVIIFTGRGTDSDWGTFLCGAYSIIVLPLFLGYWGIFIKELIKKLKERKKTKNGTQY